MSEDAGTAMKSRLRADLRTAMKDRCTAEARTIRALIAAIDNAEAPPLHPEPTALHHDFRSGSAEVERLFLTGTQVRDVLSVEMQEFERAATEFARLNNVERADALRAEALLVKRYIE